MEINFEDYLSDYDIKQIVQDEFKNEFRRYLNTNGIKIFIENLSYEYIFDLINKEVPNFETLIKKQVKQKCKDITTYCVFREKDTFNKEDSLGQKYLNKAVEDNKNLINDRVIEIFKQLDEQDLRGEMCSILEDKFDNLFKGDKGNSNIFGQ